MALAVNPQLIVPEARDLRDQFVRKDRKPLVPSTVDLADYQRLIAANYRNDTWQRPTKESYDRFMRELLPQWEAVKSTFTVIFHNEDPTPELYAVNGKVNSAKMLAHIRSYCELHVYRSDGSHNILDQHFIDYDGNSETMNSIFRAVHDILGHAATGASFGWKGETTAYYSHASTFSREAQYALFSETVAQQCVYAVTGDFAPQVGVYYPSIYHRPPLS